jgi:hypothetical protein
MTDTDINRLIDRLSDLQRRQFGLWCAARVRRLGNNPSGANALAADVAARYSSRAAVLAAVEWASRSAVWAAGRGAGTDAQRDAARDAERAAQFAELNRLLEETKR